MQIYHVTIFRYFSSVPYKSAYRQSNFPTLIRQDQDTLNSQKDEFEYNSNNNYRCSNILQATNFSPVKESFVYYLLILHFDNFY